MGDGVSLWIFDPGLCVHVGLYVCVFVCVRVRM